MDLVAHKDLQEYLDSQTRKQAQFYILQRARCMVVMIFSYIFIHLLYIHICITSHKINSLFLIFFFTTTILLTVVLGTNLLLFTFPMMFIGAVSCIYLHLIQQNRTEQKSYPPQGSTYIYASYPLNLDLHIISKYICFLLCICFGFSSGGVNRWLSLLRRPLLVMSPIGVVTVMELTFAVMFGALLIWSLSNYLHTSFGHLYMHKEGEKV